MGKSIKRSVMIRVICAIAAVLIFSGVTTMNILSIEGTQRTSTQARIMPDTALTAAAKKAQERLTA